MLHYGAINNSPVTIEEVVRATMIHGQGVSNSRDKTHEKTSMPTNTVQVPREVSSKLIHTDIIFVEKIAYLTTCSTLLGLSMVIELGATKGARRVSSIQKKFSQHVETPIDMYTSDFSTPSCTKTTVNCRFTTGAAYFEQLTISRQSCSSSRNPRFRLIESSNTCDNLAKTSTDESAGELVRQGVPLRPLSLILVALLDSNPNPLQRAFHQDESIRSRMCYSVKSICAVSPLQVLRLQCVLPYF